MKKITIIILTLVVNISFAQKLPNVPSGTIIRIENLKSQFVTPRNVDIWLPQGYNIEKKYAVLYMHDGQSLYDSTTTWNHQAWNVNLVATKLMQEGKVQDFIVVGIWNGGNTRHSDYFPQKPFEKLTREQKDFVSQQLQEKGRIIGHFQPNSDNYLKFIVKELKPLIDKRYSVYKDRKHTFIIGSSMGGLISMYAICEYPKVFGGAACMSTHWPGIFSLENNPIPNAFVEYMNKHLPNYHNHRIYFDYGDKTLDSMYRPLQHAVDKVLKVKGYTDRNWTTKFFPGNDHSEKSWNDRLYIPLTFLLNHKNERK